MRAGVSAIIAGMLLLLQALGSVSRSVYATSDSDQVVLDENAAGRSGVVGSDGEQAVGAGGHTIPFEDNDEFLGFEAELVHLQAFPEHQLRITNTRSTLCDTSVKQHSGYLDISDGRHLFFWFFESRHDPQDAPLMLWLNGGPGCSSIASGLLFENGPCFVAEGGNSTVRNAHSWNEAVNIIYLDEPVGTGYSYASDGSKVDTLADLTIDVYAFLVMFLEKWPQYATAPFHLAAESWGGHYGPHIASYIHEKNQEFIYYPREDAFYINLASLIIANGLTEPWSQFESIPEYKCGGAPYPFLEPNSLECRTMRANRPLCLSLISACYRFQTQASCAAATTHCWPTMMIGGINDDTNPYDIRVRCDEGAKICYPEIDDAETWMNSTAVKKALGAGVDRNFQACNMDVNFAFYQRGQALTNSAALLPKLLHGGVRLLVYAGNTDAVCNYQGVELWMTRLSNAFHTEFLTTVSVPWRTLRSNYLAGQVRSAGGAVKGAGNYTFVQIYDAGHMAPHDQPEATLVSIFVST
ncbi:hypothetical protein EUX98_g3169 [Antrodiella citrinella]|uniref:Carboxypeptidase n=1 Tax=Antrodiella citrinella TaxID=2447956 RepID=A0A4S4N023_9APHY|nr:hypothetical protein EUX98_g3169 [Antrodiella citrinella]